MKAFSKFSLIMLVTLFCMDIYAQGGLFRAPANVYRRLTAASPKTQAESVQQIQEQQATQNRYFNLGGLFRKQQPEVKTTIASDDFSEGITISANQLGTIQTKIKSTKTVPNFELVNKGLLPIYFKFSVGQDFILLNPNERYLRYFKVPLTNITLFMTVDPSIAQYATNAYIISSDKQILFNVLSNPLQIVPQKVSASGRFWGTSTTESGIPVISTAMPSIQPNIIFLAQQLQNGTNIKPSEENWSKKLYSYTWMLQKKLDAINQDLSNKNINEPLSIYAQEGITTAFNMVVKNEIKPMLNNAEQQLKNLPLPTPEKVQQKLAALEAKAKLVQGKTKTAERKSAKVKERFQRVKERLQKRGEVAQQMQAETKENFDQWLERITTTGTSEEQAVLNNMIDKALNKVEEQAKGKGLSDEDIIENRSKMEEVLYGPSSPEKLNMLKILFTRTANQ